MSEPINDTDLSVDERIIHPMISRLPTGDDIAQLLLLCAPPDFLKELDLSEENKSEFASIFNSVDEFYKIQTIAMALFYANRNTVGFIKSHSIVRLLYISPEVVHSLIQLADIESFSETEGLLIEVAKDKKSKAGKDAINARHDKSGGSRDLSRQINAIWATGKYTTKDICAEEEYQALGYKTFGTARKALSKPKNNT